MLERKSTLPSAQKTFAFAGGVLIALVAVRLCLLQGWVRPVRISGGSMAENLPGEHFGLRCGECAFPCRYDAEHPPADERVVCPNCGAVQRHLHGAVLNVGQRVWIDRWAGLWQRPKRWDVVALRSRSDPDYLEVKRVVGLPGEQLSIRRGDLYANGQIVRKSLDQFRRIAILVHDNGFEPAGVRRLPARWRAPVPPWDTPLAGEPNPAAGSAIPLSAWLVYHHWRCFASPLPRTDESPVLDNYGYNQNESRQLHRVQDLLLVARLRWEGDRGSVVLRGYDGDDWYRATLEFPARQAKLYRGSQLVATAPLPAAAYARDVELEFALYDRQVVLAVDERVVVGWRCELADEAGRPANAASEHGPLPEAALRREQERAWAQRQPLGIAVRGLSAVIRRLQVFRDLHYLDPRGLGRDWSAPAPLGNDEVLVLGDNVPISRDSRHGQPPGVARDRLLGPVLPAGR